MKAAGPYQPCKWDEVAVLRTSPHFPFCSERCKHAFENDPCRKGVADTLTRASETNDPEVLCTPPAFDFEQEFALIERTLPLPDELSEWDERWFTLPEHEKTLMFGSSGMRGRGIALQPLTPTV